MQSNSSNQESLQSKITSRLYHLHVCVLVSQPSAPDCGTSPGWRKNNNICYYYNDTDIVDFHTAMRRCYAEKASLVSILNKDEQAYVNSMVRLFSFLFTVEYVVICYSEYVCVMPFCSSRWGQARFQQLGLG